MNDLLNAYQMYQKMIRYPHLMGEMRSLFLTTLEREGIATEESIEREAREMLDARGLPATEENVRQYRDGLIDLHFASRFSPEETENHINLARKNDAFHHLRRVVNTERASSQSIKQVLKEFCSIPQGSMHISSNDAEAVRVALIHHFISDQLPFIGIAKNHITIRDVNDMMDNCVWNRRRGGRIGGKAAGMFLAYRIVLPRLEERDPEIERYVALPESFYFNSGILADFIDYNGFYSFHSQKYKSREVIEEEYGQIARQIDRASFPSDVVEDFRHFLVRIGEHPLILRSSSLLEDNFGHAFSGKYDSVFIANMGDIDTRLSEFIRAYKQVFKSIFSPSAILYRRDHNLLDFDEKMSVLVQKVVGRRFGDYFFPMAAGVAYSRNAYTWTPRIRREDGLVRFVAGLGTRAVDRTGPDYTRLVALSHPLLRPEVNAEQIMKYSQKMADVLDLKSGKVETVSFRDLTDKIDHPDLFYVVSLNQEGHLSPPMFKGQKIDLGRGCVTFENLLTRTPFVPLMKKILKMLEEAYGRPVDVEFAWDDDRLYLLQCRTLAIRERMARVVLPLDIPRERVLFTSDRSIFSGIARNIEYVVYVDPKAYAGLATLDEKLAVARVVGRLNRTLENKRLALFGPGRWGSNDINLGVKVGYEDIHRTVLLGEIAFELNGGAHEVSYGTHFFNDLVEARILPVAIYPDRPETAFREDFFLESPNGLEGALPEFSSFVHVVRLIHVPSCTDGLLLHVFQDDREQKGVGFLAPQASGNGDFH